ncbi:hypothetical protein BU17DRAFT_99660 [Hysterangium stoloniferum]|nr:hypothetical protein BU17DRAFT_99660 [Hysterangium stoloniferum]
MDVFDNFGSLDGLIQGTANSLRFDRFSRLMCTSQVIYHSTSCFILTSNVEIAAWVIELGLVGGSGRWWRGSWSKTDVLKFAGCDVTEKYLENLALKLSNYIIAGELSITGWSDESEPNVSLRINPTDISPIEIDLKLLPSTEGAARATNILKGVALQAQSHGCRLFGAQAPPSPAFLPTAFNPTSKSKSALAEPSQVASTSVRRPKKAQEQNKQLELAQERIKRLENEVNLVKQAAIVREIDSTPKHAAPKPPKGASRANPTRQKRKIVEAEFESD